jgi:phospholipid N-methyltransferase
MKKPKETGAIAPSSKFLTNEIIRSIDFRSSDYIVELGPGLGTFTKHILKKANKNARLLCFEVNKKFCSYLNKNINDKRLVLINSGAESINYNLRKFGIKKADCVVSGLPFNNFSNAKRKRILMEVKNSLKDGGIFVLFQYTNGLNPMLKVHFKKVRKKFVPINVPPSFVYVCVK